MKTIMWLCDGEKCGRSNIRHTDKIINDDHCDHCGKYVHEPVTEELTSKPTTKRPRKP